MEVQQPLEEVHLFKKADEQYALLFIAGWLPVLFSGVLTLFFHGGGASGVPAWWKCKVDIFVKTGHWQIQTPLCESKVQYDIYKRTESRFTSE